MTEASNPITQRHNEWGLAPPRNLTPDEPLWGARAIFKPDAGDFMIDILWDRQSWSGPPDACRALSTWLNQTGLPGLRELIKERCIRGSDSTPVKFMDDNYIVEGNPRGSFGYLYLVAYPAEIPCSTD
jgi:hypothetical protein